MLSIQSRYVTPLFKNMILSRILQFFIWSFGISFFVWAYLDPRFQDVEEFLNGRFCLPVSVGVALIVLGGAINGRLRKTAFWFALLLVGQAVALQMIDAGHLIRYQHYKPFDHLLTEIHPSLLIYLVMQTALVIVGLRDLWADIQTWVGCTFRTWQLLGIGFIFFLSSATVSHNITAYIFELLFATFVQVVNLGNIVVLVYALPEEILDSLRRRLSVLFDHSGKGDSEKSGGLDRFAIIAAVWVTVLASILSFFIYQRHPHIPDEVSYLYQARYLAEGALTLPAPPVQDAFNIDLMHYEEDRWYSPFPPGWPVMLTLGILLGVPWLVNPVLAGLNVLLTYIFILKIYDRRTARIVVLLLCFSPWYIFMSMNFMAHTFTLTCALVAALALVWARKTGKALWGWVSGIATGMVSLIRPLDGLIVAGLLGLWAIGLGGQRLKASSIVALLLGSIVVGSMALPYNNLVTGNPFKSPVMAYFDKYYGPNTNALGFGPERGVGWPIDPFPGHSPIDALVNANLNIFSVNIELLGWGTGSLIFIALMLFSKSMRRSDYLMFAVIVAVLGAYSFYWFSGGPDFGARYWYLILVPCVALTVRGIQFLERKFEMVSGSSTRVIAGILVLCILTLINYFPWRAVDKYYHYLNMRPDIRYLAKEYGFGKSIVLIRGNRHPDYASAAVYNPLDIRADVPVYAWDQNPETLTHLLNTYPDRPVWIVNGPSITHRGFEVVKGPLSGHDLITGDKGKMPFDKKS